MGNTVLEPSTSTVAVGAEPPPQDVMPTAKVVINAIDNKEFF
ncbi:hypothetical protein LYNGBM3L_13430 [Moorena producens 3L]|uniref:Uncharacterized protein n=1 Tax=Moorena producens 3L TaxID=489825 RepID=F4XL13_9CYAN|nr:hypothetical protein LYNGBM3L_13430 [Moorena producens 3L]